MSQSHFYRVLLYLSNRFWLHPDCLLLTEPGSDPICTFRLMNETRPAWPRTAPPRPAPRLWRHVDHSVTALSDWLASGVHVKPVWGFEATRESRAAGSDTEESSPRPEPSGERTGGPRNYRGGRTWSRCDRSPGDTRLPVLWQTERNQQSGSVWVLPEQPACTGGCVAQPHRLFIDRDLHKDADWFGNWPSLVRRVILPSRDRTGGGVVDRAECCVTGSVGTDTDFSPSSTESV